MTNSTPSMPLTEPPQKRLSRLISVALPAAGITTGLFFAMQSLIAEDAFSPPDLVVYELPPYVEQTPPPKPIPVTKKPQRPEILSPPANPPKLVSSINAPDVPIEFYSGAAPADYGEAILKDMKPQVRGMVIDRTLQPISPPIPTYPRAAARQGLESDCNVHLKVSPRGEPFDVYAECSHPAFEKEAKRAIEKVRFAPQIRQGLPVTVTGVVYPLEFRLKQ